MVYLRILASNVAKKKAVRVHEEHERESLIVAVYVDDLFVTGTSVSLINSFKIEMASKFEMSDLGKLTY